MTQELEQGTIYDSSSSSAIVEQSDYNEEITKLRTELIALKSFLTEQLHFIKQSVCKPFKVEKNSCYISRLLEDINYLKQGSKTKSSIIQLLIQSGDTNNYHNDNSYSKSNNNEENNNGGTENDDVNIHIPNDDSNITIRHCKNKSSKDKSTYINNKNKTSNKINGKNDNNKKPKRKKNSFLVTVW